MENEIERLDPRPLLLKRFVWDIFPHQADLVRDAQGKLGLVPDHADGIEVEHDASDTRINRVAPLISVLETLSGYAAEVVGLYLLAMFEGAADDQDFEVPDGFRETFARQNGEVIFDSTYAILCHLLDTGVLAYGEKVRG